MLEAIDFGLQHGISGVNLLVLMYVGKCVLHLQRDVSWLKGRVAYRETKEAQNE